MKTLNSSLAALFLTLAIAFPFNTATAQNEQAAIDDPLAETNTDDQNKLQVEEVLVTAQRREENLQDVPIAITSLSAKSLETMVVTGSEGLAVAVPGLTFTRIGASGIPFIRGIGSAAGDPSSEPSVATYIDGVYVASPNVNIFEFNNIETIDVLKGPQGTLFGRNATGGVLMVNTKDPSFTPDGNFQLGYANYNTLTATGYWTSPVSDTLAFNIAGHIRDQSDGYGLDVFNGEETYMRDESSIRAKLLYRPSELTEILFAIDYTQAETTGEDYKLPNGAVGRDGLVTDLGRYDTENGFRTQTDPKSRGASLSIEHDFGSFSLRSISAYRKATTTNLADVDMTPPEFFWVILTGSQHNFSQEIHLLSPDDSRVTWLLGAYYYDSDAGYDPLSIGGTDLGGLILDFDTFVRTKSFSLFAQATAEIFTDTNLTGGLRWTDEKQTYTTTLDSSIGILSPTSQADQSFSKPTWRIALDHQFTPDIMAYVSYSRGIKSGGYGLLTAVDSAAFKPEQVDAYEVGLKTELLDRRLRLNTSVFWYDWKDIQVQVVVGSATFTQNAAAARIKGFEVELQAIVTEQFYINGGIAYTDGEYTDFPDAGSFDPGVGPLIIVDATGNTTVRTPKWSGNVSFNYDTPFASGNLLSSATVAYMGKFYWSADNQPSQDDYTVFNLSLLWTSPSEKYNLNLWGKNLTDEAFNSIVSQSSYGNLTRQGDPRTYGVTFGVNF